MNYVTSIFGVPSIDHKGRHWLSDLAFPQEVDNPSQFERADASD